MNQYFASEAVVSKSLLITHLEIEVVEPTLEPTLGEIFSSSSPTGYKDDKSNPILKAYRKTSLMVFEYFLSDFVHNLEKNRL